MSKNRIVEVDAITPKAEVTDRLEICDEIGAGGMCVVREAFDRNLLRPIAIKQLHDKLAEDKNSRRRMVEEAQLSAQLDHPNIVPIYEVGELEKDQLYFTMKKVEGQTLFDLIVDLDYSKRTEEQLFEQLHYFLKVCDAMAFAHSRGVIHRDLKCENIMIGDFGEVYLMDWGIAKLREPQVSRKTVDLNLPEEEQGRHTHSKDLHVVGTPYYMSPEQAVGDHAATDTRSDIFSLGAILYEILVQEPPFDGATLMVVLGLARECKIKPPQEVADYELPSMLCQIAMKAMSKKPEDRHQTVQELKTEILHFMQSGWQFQVKAYQFGEAIVKEGEQGDTAYIIVKGHCQVSKMMADKEVILAEMGPGEVFGETAVFADEPRNATVTALDNVVVQVVPREHFEGDLGMGQSMGRFVKALAQRFNERTELSGELSKDLEAAAMFNQIFKYMIFSGEDTPEGRREVRWSSLCETLRAQYNRDEQWLMAAIQEDSMFQIDIGRDIISLGKLAF